MDGYLTDGLHCAFNPVSASAAFHRKAHGSLVTSLPATMLASPIG